MRSSAPRHPIPGRPRTAPGASAPGLDARTVVLVVSPVQHGSGLGMRRDETRDGRSGPAGPSARFEGAVRRRPAAISARPARPSPARPCPAARPLEATPTPTPTARRGGSRSPIAPRPPACPGGRRSRAAHAETLFYVQTPCRRAVAVRCSSPRPARRRCPPPPPPCAANGGPAEGNPGPVTSGLPPALRRDVRRAPAARGGGHGEEPGAEGGEGGQRLRYRSRRCRREGPREGPSAARHLRAEEGEREPAGTELLRGFPGAAGLRVVRSRPWFSWAASKAAWAAGRGDLPRPAPPRRAALGERPECCVCVGTVGTLSAGEAWACWSVSRGPQK